MSRHTESFRVALLRQLDGKRVTLFTGGNTFSGKLDCYGITEGTVVVHTGAHGVGPGVHMAGTIVFVDSVTAMRDGV